MVNTIAVLDPVHIGAASTSESNNTLSVLAGGANSAPFDVRGFVRKTIYLTNTSDVQANVSIKASWDKDFAAANTFSLGSTTNLTAGNVTPQTAVLTISFDHHYYLLINVVSNAGDATTGNLSYHIETQY